MKLRIIDGDVFQVTELSEVVEGSGFDGHFVAGVTEVELIGKDSEEVLVNLSGPLRKMIKAYERLAKMQELGEVGQVIEKKCSNCTCCCWVRNPRYCYCGFLQRDVKRKTGRTCKYFVAKRERKPSLFSGMCAEEIQKVADSLHGLEDYTGHEKKLLILIANLAARLKEKE